jgi:L-ribulose-5-phosphate 3-epimerase
MKTPSAPLSRREFLGRASAASAGLSLLGLTGCAKASAAEPLYRVSIAEWSLHRAILRARTLDHLDFARTARESFGLDGVEYVNQMFMDKARDQAYLAEMKKRADDHGVQSLLIMVDGEGNLGEADPAARRRAVENHHPWIDAAHFLGCHSIRVNASGSGSREALADAVVDGLSQLSEYAAQAGLNVTVENHGGYSSDAAWLAGVMARVNLDNCGTLPDFGNFCIARQQMADGSNPCVEEYDRYRGVEELMPYAKAVSAKSHDFDADGNEIHTDYERMMRIVLAAGYRGYVGIEYEGGQLDEMTGIRRTLELLERVRAKLAAEA